MSEEELLKKYGCNSLSEFIDTYLDCETAFDILRTQFKEIERLNNIIKEAIEYIEDNSDDMHTYISQAITQILKGSDKE